MICTMVSELNKAHFILCICYYISGWGHLNITLLWQIILTRYVLRCWIIMRRPSALKRRLSTERPMFTLTACIVGSTDPRLSDLIVGCSRHFSPYFILSSFCLLSCSLRLFSNISNVFIWSAEHFRFPHHSSKGVWTVQACGQAWLYVEACTEGRGLQGLWGICLECSQGPGECVICLQVCKL